MDGTGDESRPARRGDARLDVLEHQAALGGAAETSGGLEVDVGLVLLRGHLAPVDLHVEEAVDVDVPHGPEQLAVVVGRQRAGDPCVGEGLDHGGGAVAQRDLVAVALVALLGPLPADLLDGLVQAIGVYGPLGSSREAQGGEPRAVLGGVFYAALAEEAAVDVLPERRGHGEGAVKVENGAVDVLKRDGGLRGWHACYLFASDLTAVAYHAAVPAPPRGGILRKYPAPQATARARPRWSG